MTASQEAPRPTHAEMLGLSDEGLALRKAFLEFGPDDEARLRALRPLAEKNAGPIVDDLYRLFLAHGHTKAFFTEPKVLERVKELQRRYFVELTRGEYGASYVENRLNVGAVHERIKLSPEWYLGAYAFYIRKIAEQMFGDLAREDATKTLFSLLKIIFLDMGLAIDTYISQREQIIRAQAEEIRELSTPVLRVRDRLLVVPIVGLIDADRAYQMTDQLLRAVRAHRAKVVVLDITGVATVDSAVANHMIQTVQAVRLLGARSIVTGVSPEIAQTLVRIGIDVSKLQAVGDLQGGLEEANRILDGK